MTDLRAGHDFWPPETLAAPSGGLHAGFGAFGVKIGFKLGKDVADIIERSPHRRGGVDLLGQGNEFNLAAL